MTTVAEADIRIGLNDAEAIAGLRAVDREVDRTLRSIDGKEAEYRLTSNLKDLKKGLKEADALVAASEKKQAALAKKRESLSGSAKGAVTKQINAEKALVKQITEQTEASRKRQVLAEQRLETIKRTGKEIDLTTRRTKTLEAAEARRDKASQAAAKAERARHVEHARGLREDARLTEKAINNERTMMRLHSDAIAMDRARTRHMLTGAAKQDHAVAKLKDRYAELERQLARTNREATKMRTWASPTVSQRVKLNQAATIAEMAALKGELAAMGKVPVEQVIDLDVDAKGAGMLTRWMNALTDTAVRVGPITTSIAGLGRGLLLLGPIVSGIVGQIGALGAVLGSGLLGGLGAATGALGAFGISLGGIGLLMPKLLNDFKNLNALQDAYHKQVLKTGVNSSKAAQKLEEFQHALGEVPPTTLKTFQELKKLEGQWNKTAEKARPAFYLALGAAVDALGGKMDLLGRLSLAAFAEARKGWEEWMKGLSGSEATQIIEDLGEAGNKSIRPLMGALGNLGTVFGRVAQSFARHLPGLMRGFEQWTQGIADATGRTEALDGGVNRMVQSMKDLGHFAQAAGRFILALFAPGVDPGQKMLQGWTKGLNDAADSMRGVKRQAIGDFFENAIDTANRFWRALKPVAELFFEWSTIMQPFTDVALTLFRVMGRGLEMMLGFGPVKTIMQGAFAVFLVAQVVQRMTGAATAIWSMAKGIAAIKAAGGLGAALKTGAMSRMFNPVHGLGKNIANARGATPATPLFTKEVGVPGGGGPNVVSGGKGPGVGGMLKALPNFAKIGLGVTALAGAFYTLHKAVLKNEENNTVKRISGDIKEMTADRNQQGLRDLITEMKRFPDGAKGMRKAAEDALASVRKLEDGVVNNSIKSNFENIARGGSASMRQIKTVVERNMVTIEQRLGQKSAAGRAAVAKNFRLAANAVRDRMRDTGKHTKQGMDLVEKYMVEGLVALGLTKAQATAKVRTGTLKNSDDRPGAATIPGAARGGVFAGGGIATIGNKGARGRDNVPANFNGQPAVVARGEQIAVFNHHQQRAMNAMLPGGLEGFFATNTRPHYMAGGGIVDLGRQLQRAGYAVSEHPAFGGVGGGHSDSSYHYKGMALDVNADAMPGGEKANLDRLYARLQNMPGIVELLWQVADHFDHLHLAMAGPGGALGSMMEVPKIPSITSDLPGAPGAAANRAIQVGRSTAKEVLEAAASSMTMEGAESFGPGAGAASRGQMETWARTALRATANLGHGGPTTANIAKILELAMKESSWIVNSMNNWDSNAQAGNPSGGLMHVTIDKVGGSQAALFDPVTNMIASIVYQMSQYHGLVTHSPYASGGVVDSMAPSKWARGGKIDRPTMLTGEDGKTSPEFVIGTNPLFKKSNVAALQAAAAKLGVPMARESHGGPNMESARVNLRKSKHKDKGRDPDALSPVKRYRELQKQEDDKQREISIAGSRVREPDSLIKETGKDANGETIYEVDQKAVEEYTGQMKDVRKLYYDLVGPKGEGGIMAKLLNTGETAMSSLAVYRQDRDNNIATIRAAIDKDEKLLKSKDKDVRKKAQARLEKNRELLQKNQQKKQDAGQIRSEIGDDLHDARFRQQEYVISKEDLGRDIRAVDDRAADDAAGSNPAPVSPEAATPGADEQNVLNALDAESALAAIGQGINGQPPRSESAILTDKAAQYQSQIEEGKGMLNDADKSNDQDAYALISSAASALQGIQAELAKFDPATNSRLLAEASRGALREFGNNFMTMSQGVVATGGLAYGFGGMVAGGRTQPTITGGRPYAGGGAGQTVINLKPTFANVPPDPHTWSKQVAFEIGAM